MAVQGSHESAGWNSVSEALAEMRAFSGGLQPLLAGVFDQLDQMASELLAHELACQRGQQEALQAQVDRLAAVASELTTAVAEQKQLAAETDNNRRKR
jgi:hypothetical protein